MRKVIKRLKCIKKTFDARFTIGEYYDITNEGTIGGIPVYYAKNNNGYSDWVIHYTFEAVEDKRDLILTQILRNDNN